MTQPTDAPAPRLADVVAVLERLYPPRWAQGWDAVGLVCGDPDAPVRRVLLAVDPVADVVAEALAWDADLVLAHHPLLLRPVHGVAATSPKGRVVHDLVRSGCALYVAHTNADSARPGVSDALARIIGLEGLVPLSATPEDPLDKVVTFVPHEHASAVVDALAGAGAGSIGEYERCAWTTTGVGTFLPGAAASPSVGEPGRVEEVPETRVEMVLPRHRRDAVVAALRGAHPYEEPAFDVLELAGWSSPRGIGRVGALESPLTLAAFAEVVARALPHTAQGVRVAGDPEAVVERVAVCGGSGDSLFDAVRASGADAFVTADLRHHPASEAREEAAGGPPYLVDVAHWASEWPWLHGAAERLASELLQLGTTVEARVSELRTDPWTFRVPSSGGLVR
ncbi:MAG: Nif3-like dinuclear metal center hexameric protein [Actinomycetes bacterium]